MTVFGHYEYSQLMEPKNYKYYHIFWINTGLQHTKM